MSPRSTLVLLLGLAGCFDVESLRSEREAGAPADLAGADLTAGAGPDLATPPPDLARADLLKPPASCSDGMKNGTETDLDCGGGSCPPCTGGKTCAAPNDCQSTICFAGRCVEFSFKVAPIAVSQPNAITAGQLDGRAGSDIAVANLSATVSILVNDGMGTFAVPATYPVQPGNMNVNGQAPVAIAAGRGFDNAGVTDLATANNTSQPQQVSALFGTAGVFAAKDSGGWPGTANGVAMANFDNDQTNNGNGTGDLAASFAGNNCIQLHLRQLGNGFQGGPAACTGGPVPIANTLRVANLDGDPLRDLVVGASSMNGNGVVRLTNGGNNWTAVHTVMGLVPVDLAVGTLDADNLDDIAVVGKGGIAVTFSGTPLLSIPPNLTGITSIAILDVNKDMANDLVYADDTGHLSLLLGDHTGKFVAGPTFLLPNPATRMTVGDWNGDGRADLAAACYADGKVLVLTNTSLP